jgi:uncharacterized protein YggU (UPF0235/DUF167 family)
MARAKAEFPPVAAILALVDGEGRLAVRVTPGARDEMLEIVEGKLVAKVRARPKDGEANAAVLALLAQALGVARSRVSLIKGVSSREKIFRV